VTDGVDIHQKIRAYLRQNGKTDMGGFHLDLSEGRTTIGRWDYSDVPQPTNDSLNAVDQQYLDYETDTVSTRDIYTGRIITDNAPSGANWLTVQLDAARFPCISTPTTPQTVKLTRGFWRIFIAGYSNGNFILQVAVGSAASPINQKRYMAGSFEMTRILHASSDDEIRLSVQRFIQNGVNTSGRLDINYTVVLEKI
jgi:hypothetical protein